MMTISLDSFVGHIQISENQRLRSFSNKYGTEVEIQIFLYQAWKRLTNINSLHDS